MNASKEEAREANKELEKAALLLDGRLPKEQRDPIKVHLIRVQDFIEAAERKLPTEAAFAKDKGRKAKA